MKDGQAIQATVIGSVNGIAAAAGAMDMLGSTAMKVIVGFVVAIASGVGYQVGRLLWEKLGGTRRD